jgi:hypothetical protein
MVTKEDLKQEIEQLDSNYLELVFRVLKQFPHQESTSFDNKLEFEDAMNYVLTKNHELYERLS